MFRILLSYKGRLKKNKFVSWVSTGRNQLRMQLQVLRDMSLILAHLDPDIFASLSWQNCSTFIGLDGDYCQQQFSNLATDSHWE